MNNLYLSILIFIIIFSSVSLQYKIKELFYQENDYSLSEPDAKILNDYNQTNAININSAKIKDSENTLTNIKEFIPSSLTKLRNIQSKEGSINKNEKIFNNISSFKYGETLFLSTYYWGGYILNGKNFSNKRRDNYKRIKITSTTGKKKHESIKYGDYIKVPGLTNDTLRIMGGTTGNSIFPGNYFYLQNSKKNYNNFQISWCHNRGYWKNWCQQHQCGNKHQWNWWWRNRKRLCNRISCDCPFKHNRQDGIFLNRNRGFWERMKFIR